MKIYIVDISGYKIQEEDKETIKAEDIVMHRDLLRGYTTNYFVANEYVKFLEEIIGHYVFILFTEFDVDDNISEADIEDYAYQCHMSLYDKGVSLYPATCPLIQNVKLEDGSVLYVTEPMMEYSTETTNYEDIVYEIVFLFDDTMKYLPKMHSDLMINFRQYMLDGFTHLLEDFYNNTSDKYCVDVYGILKIYIKKLLFIDTKGGW